MKQLLSVLLFLSFGITSQAQTLEWLDVFEGKYNDYFNDAYVTPNGDIVVWGAFHEEFDFDPGPGTLLGQTPGIRQSAGLILQTDTSGAYEWGYYLATDNGPFSFFNFRDMTIDMAGYIYLAGSYTGTLTLYSPQGPVSTYTSPGTNNPVGVGFLTRISPSGNIEWFHEFYGDTLNGSNTLFTSVHWLNNTLIAKGNFDSATDFDPGVGTSIQTPSTPFATQDILLELNANATFQRATVMDLEFVNEIREDAQGNIYITGSYFGPLDVDPSAATFTLTSNDQADLYLIKLNAQRGLEWAYSYGGQDDDRPTAMLIDQVGNTYLTVFYRSSVDFDPGPGQTIFNNSSFQTYGLLKYDPDGDLVWGVPTDGDIRAEHVVWTPTGDLVISGVFTGDPDFDPGMGVVNLAQPCTMTCSEGFALTLDSANGSYISAQTWINGPGSPFLSNMNAEVFHVDASGNNYVLGHWSGTKDFDPSADSLFLTASITDSAGADAFLVRFGPDIVSNRPEPSGTERITVFPNPASEKVFIQKGSSRSSLVELWDLHGKLVRRENIRGTVGELDVSFLEAGVYMLRIDQMKAVKISVE